jgi:hypothetical protein
MVVLFLPLMLAELIPLDRQQGVREVIDALPLSPHVYLAGKLVGGWGVTAAGLLLAGVVSGALSWMRHGPFHVGTVAGYWLVGLLPLALFAAQMGVMLPARQPNRRRAIPVALIGVIASLAAIVVLPAGTYLYATAIRLGAALEPERFADPYVQAVLPSVPGVCSWSNLARIGLVALAMVAVWLGTAHGLRGYHDKEKGE